jgi:LuxR family maltose regulon positive regulatory protein
VWEGQAILVEQLLQPTLAALEGRIGRRGPLSCMVAALLAAAVWEQNRPAEAIAFLADRLDVLDQVGLPETLLLAYRTLARIAVAENAEPRALQLLAEMRAVAAARGLHRLGIVSLAEEARLHARRYRAETCAELARRVDEAVDRDGATHGPLWHGQVAVLRHIAHAHAAIASRDWRRAVEPLRTAESEAGALKLGRVGIEIKGLRAWVLSQCGERTESLMAEAADLAGACGLVRIFGDAHPDLGQWHEEVARGAGKAAVKPSPVAPAPAATPARVFPSMALTPKEREVLVLLARGLTNKEIGLALQASELTVKWHLRNLFSKMNAGTRKQAVSRARILGLLDAE